MDEARIRKVNHQGVRAEGAFVLYWMIAARRTRYNFGLERALALARELDKPLVVVEALRCGYLWASDRLHTFVLQGMADNAARFREAGILYHGYVEPKPGDGKGLVAALSRQACVVVTDDFPCFMLPHMVAAAGLQAAVRLEAIDSNGLVPMREAGKTFYAAVHFRRHLQKTLRPHLDLFPKKDPLRGAQRPILHALPSTIARQWPSNFERIDVARLPIDHTVGVSPIRGGSVPARAALSRFVQKGLARYLDDRNDPDLVGTSGLSPYLHFGHISTHEIFAAVAPGFVPSELPEKATAKREGWWGLPAPVEAFLDQLVTWRELGYNFCALRDDYDSYASLPDWAQATLKKHQHDVRPHNYTLAQLEAGTTYDPIWNAAQMQLVREGEIHNYMRMLWGKKIVEWSPTPQEALTRLIALNDKYALDGRDPNSYSGIFWCLGRFDRAWGPERPIFGTVRYMSTASADRKLKLREYVKRYAP